MWPVWLVGAPVLELAAPPGRDYSEESDRVHRRSRSPRDHERRADEPELPATLLGAGDGQGLEIGVVDDRHPHVGDQEVMDVEGYGVRRRVGDALLVGRVLPVPAQHGGVGAVQELHGAGVAPLGEAKRGDSSGWSSK